MRLQGKAAIITGGGSGIGRAAALCFAREGAAVVIAERDEAAGAAVLGELQELGARAAFFPTDVSRPDSVERLVVDAVEWCGRIDILVNNAGITRDAMLSNMTLEAWHAVMDVNLHGVFYCTRTIAPHMIQTGKGSIINTSSIVGQYGNIGQTNYAASKAGVIGLTRTWAKELGYKGVRVNAVAPGFIQTPMVERMPEKVLQKMLEKVPLRRLGRPEDIANAYLFLASDESDYVNGAVLEVNGGLVI